MEKFDVLIPLGGCCLATYVTRTCGHNTGNSPYSWISIPEFADVVSTMEKFPTDFDISDEKYVGYPQLHCKDFKIWLSHYTKEQAVDICSRRHQRMIDIIKSDKKILFLRVNHYSDNINVELLNDFDRVVKKINPDVNYKILVVDEYPTHNEIQEKHHPNMIYKYYVGDIIFSGKYQYAMQCDMSNNLHFWNFMKDMVEYNYMVPVPLERINTHSD